MTDFEDACRTLLDWRQQGVKMKRLTVMTLACEDNNKRMGDVVRVNGVDILVYRPPIWVNTKEHLAPWQAPETEPQTWAGQGLRIRRRGPERLLDPHANSDLIELVLTSKCGCTRTTTLGVVRAGLADGTSRLIVRGNEV